MSLFIEKTFELLASSGILLGILTETASMMSLFGPLLATALMAQFQGRTLQGTVVDAQGKPVADAQVIFHAPAPWKGDAAPAEVRAKTDDEGRFRLTTSRMAGIDIFD